MNWTAIGGHAIEITARYWQSLLLLQLSLDSNSQPVTRNNDDKFTLNIARAQRHQIKQISKYKKHKTKRTDSTRLSSLRCSCFFFSLRCNDQIILKRANALNALQKFAQIFSFTRNLWLTSNYFRLALPSTYFCFASFSLILMCAHSGCRLFPATFIQANKIENLLPNFLANLKTTSTSCKCLMRR